MRIINCTQIDYESEVFVANQFKVFVPISLINFDSSLRKLYILRELKTKYRNLKSGSLEYWQRFAEVGFRLYKQKYGEEFEANLCKNEKDVINLYLKGLYNIFKRKAEQEKDTVHVIYDFPDSYSLLIGIINPEYTDGLFDKEKSYISLIKVGCTEENGKSQTEFSFIEFENFYKEIKTLYQI